MWPDTALLTSETLEGLSKEVKTHRQMDAVKPLVWCTRGNLGKNLEELDL